MLTPSALSLSLTGLTVSRILTHNIYVRRKRERERERDLIYNIYFIFSYTWCDLKTYRRF